MQNGRGVERHSLVAALALAYLCAAGACYAAVEPAPIFGDHMVLQCRQPVPVSGTADPGAEVTVEFGDRKETATADKDGNWKVILAPMKACAEPRTLTITSTLHPTPSTFSDVLVGEVWIGSGQSNMAWDMNRTGFAKKGLPEADNPLIRYHKSGPAWTPMSKESCGPCSANMFFFAVRLQKELGVPVGIIVRAQGFTTVSHWTPENVLGTDTRCLQAFDRHQALVDLFARRPFRMPDNQAQKLVPKAFDEKDTAARRNRAGGGYGRIRALQPLAVRGVCWNQGFSGSGHNGLGLVASTAAMIDSWRRDWGRDAGALPFLVVQKPPGADDRGIHRKTAHLLQPGTPVLDFGRAPRQNWELQERMAHVHIANNMDLPGGMHPGRKDAMGYRLAEQALAHVYERDVPHRTPVVTACRFEDGKAFLTYAGTGDGLRTSDDEALRGFFIAGPGRVFFPAQAEIIAPDTVHVHTPDVEKPAIVVYGSVGNYGNLVSSDGLFAFPWRSSPWDMPDPAAVEKRVWPIFEKGGALQPAAGLLLWQLGIREADSVARLAADAAASLPDDPTRAQELMFLLARHVATGDTDIRRRATQGFETALNKAPNAKRFNFVLRKKMQYRVPAAVINSLLGARK